MKSSLKLINFSIGFFFIISFYNLARDAFGVTGGSYLDVFLMLGISGVVLYEYCSHFHQHKFTMLGAVVLLWSAIVLVNIIATSGYSDSSMTILVRNSFWWVIIYLYGTILGQFGDLSHIRKVFIYILPILIYLLIRVSRYRTLLLYIDSQASINYVFFILVLLPYYLTVNKPKYRLLFLFIVVIACFYSMKRSATIIALLSMFAYMVYYLSRKKTKNITKLSFLVIFLALSVFSLKYVNELSGNHLVERFDNISKDGGSGRSTIYANVWESFKQNRIEYVIAGRGYNSVMSDQASGSHLSAHNDFLEVLYDYGILGFSVYLAIWFCLFRRLNFLRKVRSEYSLPYIISLIIFLVLSMVSHLIIYPTFFVGLTLFWGYIEGYYVGGRIESPKNT